MKDEEENSKKIKLDYKFVCRPNSAGKAPDFTIIYVASANKFEIETTSIDGCGIDLSFFKSLSEHPIPTAIVFLLIGLVFCFMGFKFYKEWIILSLDNKKRNRNINLNYYKEELAIRLKIYDSCAKFDFRLKEFMNELITKM